MMTPYLLMAANLGSKVAAFELAYYYQTIERNFLHMKILKDLGLNLGSKAH